MPFTHKEMDIITAIKKIDPHARFKIVGNLENRIDYLYGGIVWESMPISWEQVLEKMYELGVEKNAN
tara:strand:+ start:360 stop:560 length:201 start_codon:yes stop_codon:yes gene_type:complete